MGCTKPAEDSNQDEEQERSNARGLEEHWEDFSNPEEENEMMIQIAAAERELMEKCEEGQLHEEERVEEGKTSRLEEDKSSLAVEMTTTNPEHDEDPELDKILNEEFDKLCDTNTKTYEDSNRDEDLQPA